MKGSGWVGPGFTRIFFFFTGMDITCLHQLWEFMCEGLCPGVHVTSDVITYHCSAG